MKILVCGDINGQFAALISKVNTLTRKNGEFDMLFCVGNFFGDDDEENVSIERNKYVFPIATYILGPNKQEHVKYYKDFKGYQLCNNLTYLGHRGIFKGTSNLSVAYLSGVNHKAGTIKSQHHFSAGDVQSLEESITSQPNFKGVDILLTSQWPEGVDKYAANINETYEGSQLISSLALSLKPRYHFSALDNVHYERTPYRSSSIMEAIRMEFVKIGRNHSILATKAYHVTRFIALAYMNNKCKKKYLYAFSIDPMMNVEPTKLNSQPAESTEIPYIKQVYASPEPKTEQPQQFFYSTPKMAGKKRPGDVQTPHSAFKKLDIAQDVCWFCLANPKSEKHLVISVGELCYLALAKGGLNDEHLLVVPINHYQSITTSPHDIMEEMEMYIKFTYKKSLTKYFKFNGKCVVFFERNYKSPHMQLQVVPLPERFEQRLAAACIKFCKDQNVDLSELPPHSDLTQIIPNTIPYFFIELPNSQKFYFRTPRSFNINFGRMLLCQVSLLNEPGKVDWKNCQMSIEDEKKCSAKIKAQFKVFDPFS